MSEIKPAFSAFEPQATFGSQSKVLTQKSSIDSL